jgi:hypothetical protein
MENSVASLALAALAAFAAVVVGGPLAGTVVGVITFRLLRSIRRGNELRSLVWLVPYAVATSILLYAGAQRRYSVFGTLLIACAATGFLVSRRLSADRH